MPDSHQGECLGINEAPTWQILPPEADLISSYSSSYSAPHKRLIKAGEKSALTQSLLSIIGFLKALKWDVCHSQGIVLRERGLRDLAFAVILLRHTVVIAAGRIIRIIIIVQDFHPLFSDCLTAVFVSVFQPHK